MSDNTRHSSLPYANDQIIDATMARSLHADACRDHALVAWVVLWDLPAYPGVVCGRGRNSTLLLQPGLCLMSAKR